MAVKGPLYLVRHLAPQVDSGICYGRTDLACSPEQITAALPALRAQLPAGVPVYSSPLRRCAELARALAGAEVRYDARLAELDFGAWEMRAWTDIPREEVDAWAADMGGYRPGGADSVVDMAHRIHGFYHDLPAGPAIVIGHAGAIRLLTACHQGLDPECMARAAAATPNPIAYGELVLLGRV